MSLDASLFESWSLFEVLSWLEFESPPDAASPPACVADVAVSVSVQIVDALRGASHTAWLPPISRDALSVDPVPAALAAVLCLDPRVGAATDDAEPALALPQPCQVGLGETSGREEDAAAAALCCADPTPPLFNAYVEPRSLNGTQLFQALRAGGTCATW